MFAGNPFTSAFHLSDWFGKSIFIALFILSAISWWILIYKCWLFYKVRKLSEDLSSQFSEKDPLGLQVLPVKGRFLEVPHPFFEVYKTLKQHVLQVISKNHFYIPSQAGNLSEADMGLIELQVHAALGASVKKLEKHLFILSTVVTLGPFLGLLGTVWGILITFSQMNMKMNNAAMLSGLSLALATTVVGLIVAIPALIGYNYLKNAMKEYRRDLEDFSHLIVTAVELHYRTPHVKTDSVQI